MTLKTPIRDFLIRMKKKHKQTRPNYLLPKKCTEHEQKKIKAEINLISLRIISISGPKFTYNRSRL